MTETGRPLRFLALVLGGWTALRVAMLLPEAAGLPRLVAAETEFLPFAIASFPPRLLGEWPAPKVLARTNRARPVAGRTSVPARAPSTANAVSIALFARLGFGTPQRRPRPTLVAPYLPPAPSAPARLAELGSDAATPSRFSGSAWLALRGDGGGASLGPGGQVGGSQGGVRLRYALGTSRRFALSARLSSPTRGPGREAALGVEWRPADAPVAVIAEQRLGLDGSPGGPALLVVGGLDPKPVAAGFTIEGYAQGGAVWRAGRSEPFADGAIRLARPIARAERADVSLGLGAWGGAQRDAQRLDIGPSLAIALPIANRSLRLSVDYRQRVAGNARPGSGLALTIGTDF